MTTHNPVEPSRESVQVSAMGADGRFILSLLTKRTYLVNNNGHCELAPEQLPLLWEPTADPANPDCLHSDADTYPFKLWTDIVVKGAAYNHPQTESFLASLEIAGSVRTLRVSGPRRCDLDHFGRTIFTPAALSDRVALSYCNAYGGCDLEMAREWSDIIGNLLTQAVNPSGQPPEQAARQALSYPRNPVGLGYLIEPTKRALQQTALPLLEDAAEVLTPEHLAVREPGRWPALPMPGCFGWVNHDWFPRCFRLGLALDEDPDVALADFSEVRRCGWSTSDLAPGDLTQPNPAGANGAEPWLQLPYVNPTQAGPIRCVNLHPRLSSWTLQLPAARPRLFVDGREGGLREVEPVLHSLIIEPDLKRVSLVWRGSAPARRPYLPDEIVQMPFRVMW